MSDQKFWQTPIGKKLMYGIHEHNSGLGSLRTSVSLLKLLRERDTFTVEDLDSSLKSMTIALDKCRDSIDYIYKSVKEHEMDNNQSKTGRIASEWDSKPWNLISILEKLTEASEILLNDKDYDGHGYEDIAAAKMEAESMTKLMKNED